MVLQKNLINVLLIYVTEIQIDGIFLIPSIELDSLVAVVVELVVWSECGERTHAHAVRKEDLRRAVDPDKRISQPEEKVV